MRLLLLSILLTLGLLPAARARAQEEAASILAPVEGQTVAGLVTVAGSAAGPLFQRYELDFGYEPNPTDTWFPIQDPVLTPQFGGPLAQWDTVAQGIADGAYVLRLRVYRADGTFAESFVHNVILQNGFAAGPAGGTAEPGLPTPTATGVFVQLPPTSTPRPTVTPQPAEAPAPGRAEGSYGPSLNLATFGRAFARGIGWTVVVFGLLGLYAGMRPRLRPRLWRLIRRLVKHR